jgi:hypothetical protein
MRTLAIVIGRRKESEFNRIIRELKLMRFSYSPGPKEWTKQIDDTAVDYWLAELKRANIECYFKD